MNRIQPNNLNGLTIHDNPVLTPKESCVLLKIGPTKLYQLINAGVLEVIHLGARSTRIKRSSIDRLLENGLSGDATE